MGDLRRKWKIWVNGLAQAVYSGAAAGLGLLLADGVLDLSLTWKQFGIAVASTVVGHVVGYMMRSPIPEVFDDEITQ